MSLSYITQSLIFIVLQILLIFNNPLSNPKKEKKGLGIEKGQK